MSNVIRVSPENMLENANKLQEIIVQTENILNQFEYITRNLNSQWSGDTQDKYNEYSLRKIKELQDFIKFYNDYKNTILEISTVYTCAEENTIKSMMK